jgi:hypothetical protein
MWRSFRFHMSDTEHSEPHGAWSPWGLVLLALLAVHALGGDCRQETRRCDWPGEPGLSEWWQQPDAAGRTCPLPLCVPPEERATLPSADPAATTLADWPAVGFRVLPLRAGAVRGRAPPPLAC